MVDQRLQELKARTHIIAVALFPAVKGRNLRFGVPTIIQICVSLRKNKGLQPPAVGPDGGFKAVFLKNPAAFQEFFRCFRQGQPILDEQAFVDEQAIGNHFLRDRYQLSIHRVSRADDIPQILRALQARQIHQQPF